MIFGAELGLERRSRIGDGLVGDAKLGRHFSVAEPPGSEPSHQTRTGKRPVRNRTGRSSERITRSMHVSQQIACAADNYDGRHGPQQQYGHTVLLRISNYVSGGRFGLQRLLLGADLGGLHAGLGFSLGLVGAVVHDGGGRRGGLGVHDGALLGRGIAHDVEFRGAGAAWRERRRQERRRR